MNLAHVPAHPHSPRRSLVLIAAVVVSLVAMTAVFTVTGRSTQAWFGSGSCPMPGGFVPGHKCLAVDANGVEVPYKGEIILPHGTTTITDHILTNASHPVTGNYQLQIVEDNGTCCAVFQTFDYTVDSSGATSPSTFVLNQATLTEAFTHHPVGNGGMVGYFLFISNPSAMGANDTCANTVTFDDGAGAPLTATSGSGKCNPPQPVPNTGELVSHIFDCAAGNLATDVVPPGTVAVTSGPLTKAAAPSPVDYITVPTGTYGLIAAAPSGYHFMGDGCLAGSKSTGSATVPVQGKGEVDFFVSRDSGSLVGHIYDCTSGTADTTHDIGGNGAIAVSGPVNKNAAPNPISYSVPTGDYTETATPPTSYHVVSAACQAPGSSTASVTVKPDKPGEAIFYVARDTGDLAGNIYDCTGGTADTSKNIAGGKLSATGPSNVAQQANPLNPTVVPSGTYKMSAVAPAGYHLVSATCQVATGADNAEVVVPANGHGVGNFFVSHDTGMLAGHIYDCSTNSQSTSEVSGGTLGASGAGTVAAAANPMPATVVPTGGYTVTGTAPGGYHFVACQESAGGASTGATVVTNQTAVAILYVAKNPPGNGGTGGGGTGGNGGTGGSGGTGGTGGAASNSPAGGVAAATGMVKGAAILVNPRTGHSDLARLSLVSLVLILMGGGILLGTRRNTKLSS